MPNQHVSPGLRAEKNWGIATRTTRCRPPRAASALKESLEIFVLEGSAARAKLEALSVQRALVVFGYCRAMAAVFKGMALGVAVLGCGLVAGCGGHVSSSGSDRNGGDHWASDGGKGGAPEQSAPVVVAGAAGLAAGGAPAAGGEGVSDQSAGAADAGSPSSTGGGPSTAGAPSSGGSAGSSGVGAAGADAANVAGAASTNPADVTAACTKLCTGWIHGCSIWEFAPTCISDCASDLAVQNGACTALGLSMLSCMTATSGSVNSSLCYPAFAVGISTCRAQVDAFLACSAGSGPAPQPKICMGDGGPLSDQGGCVEVSYCLNSISSQLRCANASNGQSSCECWNYDTTTKANDSTTFTFDGQSGDLCAKHMDECLAFRSAP